MDTMNFNSTYRLDKSEITVSKVVDRYFELIKSTNRVILQKNEFPISQTVSAGFEKIRRSKTIITDSVEATYGRINSINNKPTVILCESLSQNNECLGKIKHINGLSTHNESVTNINRRTAEKVFASPSFDNLIIMYDETKGSEGTLLFDMWNIIPGVNNFYFRLYFKCKSAVGDVYVHFPKIIETVLNKTVEVYQQYRSPVSKEQERVKAEIKILNDIFYRDVTITKKGRNWGLEIPLKKSRVWL